MASWVLLCGLTFLIFDVVLVGFAFLVYRIV